MDRTVVSSGLFRVREGEVDRFLERWGALITWSREHHPGMGKATLSRSDADPLRFVSFAEWEAAELRERWRADPGYSTRSSACRGLCDEYQAGDYHQVLSFGDAT
jgi:quinol monooxygenase YgiN